MGASPSVQETIPSWRQKTAKARFQGKALLKGQEVVDPPIVQAIVALSCAQEMEAPFYARDVEGPSSVQKVEVCPSQLWRRSGSRGSGSRLLHADNLVGWLSFQPLLFRRYAKACAV